MSLIFDFDGVIVDSEKSTFILLQEICKRHNVELIDDALHKRVGMKITHFVDEYFGNELSMPAKQSIIDEFYDIFLKTPNSYVQPIGYVCDFIKSYNGPRKLAIASVGHRKSIEHILESLRIRDKFEVILSSEDVKKIKPDPEVYIEAAQRLNELPKNCLAFEDSKVGAVAALSAGCNLHVVLNGLNSKAEFKDMAVSGYVSSTIELLKLSN
jgi:beta-phosphoglucomutase-like phosphatase (HAD superfamily)